MKIRLFILIICIVLSVNTFEQSYALNTKLPAQQQVPSDEELNAKTTNMFFGFLGGIIRVLRGETDEIPLKSEDVNNLSSVMKSYDEHELSNNSSYKDSHSQEKLNFGTAVLDIIAGFLAFFGI